METIDVKALFSRKGKPNDVEHVADIFASGFEVHDWEDWVRIVCLVDTVEPSDGAHEQRAKVRASIVVPRSSIYDLLQALRQSVGHVRTPERH